MNRKVLYIISLAALSIVVLHLTGRAGIQKTGSRLRGFIELVQDFGVKRLFLQTSQGEWIMKKHDGFLVDSVDLSPDGSQRVITLATSDNGPTRLGISIRGKEFKTLISNNFVNYPSFSPNGRNIAYLFSPEEKKRQDWFSSWFLYLTDSQGKSNKKLSTMPLWLGKPSWFPNGNSIAVGSKDMKIYAVDIKSGATKQIIDFGTCPTVSHDGRQIAFLTNDVDEKTRKEIISFTKITAAEYQAMVQEKTRSKDLAAIERYFIEHSVYIYDVDTGKTRKIASDIFVEQPVIWSHDDRYLLYNDRSDVAEKIFVVDTNTCIYRKVTNETGRIMVWR